MSIPTFDSIVTNATDGTSLAAFSVQTVNLDGTPGKLASASFKLPIMVRADSDILSYLRGKGVDTIIALKLPALKGAKFTITLKPRYVGARLAELLDPTPVAPPVVPPTGDREDGFTSQGQFPVPATGHKRK